MPKRKLNQEGSSPFEETHASSAPKRPNTIATTSVFASKEGPLPSHPSLEGAALSACRVTHPRARIYIYQQVTKGEDDKHRHLTSLSKPQTSAPPSTLTTAQDATCRTRLTKKTWCRLQSRTSMPPNSARARIDLLISPPLWHCCQRGEPDPLSPRLEGAEPLADRDHPG